MNVASRAPWYLRGQLFEYREKLLAAIHGHCIWITFSLGILAHIIEKYMYLKVLSHPEIVELIHLFLHVGNPTVSTSGSSC